MIDIYQSFCYSKIVKITALLAPAMTAVFLFGDCHE